MSRRHRAEKREVNPDPKFGDVVLSKFMNSIMLDGKKSVAERIVYGALDEVEDKAKANPVETFQSAQGAQEKETQNGKGDPFSERWSEDICDRGRMARQSNGQTCSGTG